MFTPASTSPMRYVFAPCWSLLRRMRWRIRCARKTRESIKQLRTQVRVPIAVGEQFGDRWDTNELIEQNLIDYTRVTLPNTGGITEFMKIATLCEAHNVGMIPHGTGPISVAALTHTLGAFSGPVLMECGSVPKPAY